MLNGNESANDPNLGVPSASNDKSNALPSNHSTPSASGEDSSAFFDNRGGESSSQLATTHAEGGKPANLSLAAFEEQHAGGAPLFQKSLDPSISARDIKSKELSALLHESCLRDHVKEFSIADDPAPLQHHLIRVHLSQTSANKGMAKRGDRAREALLAEFLQPRDMGTLVPTCKKNLTKQQRKNSLRATSIIKEKRDGTLKGRTYAFGKAQRGLRENTKLPLQRSTLICLWEPPQ